MRPFFKLFSSVKLAVFIMTALAALIAAGTFVEANYNDAQAAAKYVYKTPWMFGLMALLAVNLIAVMVDRWPWKLKHGPFLAAHVGILLLLLGSWITMKFGLDGNLAISIGSQGRFVRVNDTDLTVWATFDGDRYTKVFDQAVDFMSNAPEKNPVVIPVDSDQIRITGYRPYVYASNRLIATDKSTAGAAMRFHIYNDRASVNEWLFLEKPGVPSSIPMGLAEIFLIQELPKSIEANHIYLAPSGDGGLKYAVFYKDGRPSRTGLLRESEEIETGWMGLKFKLLRYYPHAERIWEFEDAPRMSDLTTSAIEVEWKGKKQWISIGDRFKIFTDKAAYLLSYSNQVVDLGFDVQLKEFEMGTYQGTSMAASYKSIVEVAGLGTQEISMNSPLKHMGKTLYQASFTNGPDGKPEMSVLSVNEDPGRWMKYLGSLIISLGVIWLFVDRRKSARAMGPKK